MRLKWTRSFAFALACSGFAIASLAPSTVAQSSGGGEGGCCGGGASPTQPTTTTTTTQSHTTTTSTGTAQSPTDWSSGATPSK